MILTDFLGTSDSTQDEAVPNKKHRTTLNNNKTIQSSGEKLVNGGHTSSQQTGSGSENNGFIGKIILYFRISSLEGAHLKLFFLAKVLTPIKCMF